MRLCFLKVINQKYCSENMSENILQFLNTFDSFTSKPHKYLSAQTTITEDVKSLIKNIYDYTKTNENGVKGGNALPELIIENFDDEQIWQELELQNENCNNIFVSEVSMLVAKKDRLSFSNQLKENGPNIEIEGSVEGISDNDDLSNGEPFNENSTGEEEEEEDEDVTDFDFKSKIKKSARNKPSIVDDTFFKLADMKHYLEWEEKNEGKSKELINYFDDIPSDDNEDSTDKKEMYYNDFFGPVEDENEEHDEEENMEGNESEQDEDVKDELDEEEDIDYDDEEVNEESKKKVRFNLLGGEEEESDTENRKMEADVQIETGKEVKEDNDSKKIKSTLEQRQDRLNRLIYRLEEEAISEKPWQMKGEITAGARPPNSLLEEVVDFDLTSRPAPVITEETSLRLEDIIIRRIKDKAWDDVERKIKPIDTPTEFKKKLVLDQEKSKLSLAEVYEQEFIKQRDAKKQAGGDDAEEQEVELPLHHEVRAMMTSLFNKLDALSNYHYTPRPAVPELKIVSNERAIVMEEVAPVTATDSTLLAPEEILAKRKGNLVGKDERTDTDKKRSRRIKKKRQRDQQKFKEQVQKTVKRINPGMGNKYSKQKAEQDLKKILNERNVSKMEENSHKAVRSSTTFFRNLQDEVSSSIHSKTKPVKKKKDAVQFTAKRLKL